MKLSHKSLGNFLCSLTELLSEEYAFEKSGGCLGGDYGYGVDFENDTFMMHPYCWCEKIDCPWCGGCLGSIPEPKHAKDCYQWVVYRELIEKGFKQCSWTTGPYVEAPQGWTWEERCKIKDEVREKWCKHFGLSFTEGRAVHCTCGANDKWHEDMEACECDFCTSKGIFGEKGATPENGAPNFWHKPSGLKVWWYKYIGRSMEIENPNDIGLKELVLSCEESLIGLEDNVEVKKQIREKNKREKEYIKWMHTKDDEGFLCHRCIQGLVLNEEVCGPNRVECLAFGETLDFKTECDDFIRRE